MFSAAKVQRFSCIDEPFSLKTLNPHSPHPKFASHARVYIIRCPVRNNPKKSGRLLIILNEMHF